MSFSLVLCLFVVPPKNTYTKHKLSSSWSWVDVDATKIPNDDGDWY